MPNIHVTTIEGTYSDEEKGQLIAGFTDAVVAIKGEGVRGFVTVLLSEVGSGNWGAGGQRVTADLALGMIAEGNEAAKAASDV